jgi:hypothetical protein
VPDSPYSTDRTYVLSIPLVGGSGEVELARCLTLESLVELVAALMSAQAQGPVTITVRQVPRESIPAPY